MRLSGHIPRGLSVPAAILLGFDEINHAAFLFSTFYQDSLYVPKMRAYSAVASAVAPNIDVEGAPMTELIKFLKAHNTVSTMKIRKRAKLFIFSDAHASTTVTEELIKTAVLKVPMGIFSKPCGQASFTAGQTPAAALTRNRM